MVLELCAGCGGLGYVSGEWPGLSMRCHWAVDNNADAMTTYLVNNPQAQARAAPANPAQRPLSALAGRVWQCGARGVAAAVWHQGAQQRAASGSGAVSAGAAGTPHTAAQHDTHSGRAGRGAGGARQAAGGAAAGMPDESRLQFLVEWAPYLDKELGHLVQGCHTWEEEEQLQDCAALSLFIQQQQAQRRVPTRAMAQQLVVVGGPPCQE
ncbi:hypothetical protein V8C86DRAFT_3036630, partial [Haematococcus lacustris]